MRKTKSKKDSESKAAITAHKENGMLRSLIVKGEPVVEVDLVGTLQVNGATNMTVTQITPTNVATIFANSLFPQLFSTSSGALYGRYRPIAFSIEACPVVTSIAAGGYSLPGFYALGPGAPAPTTGISQDVLNIQNSMYFFPAAAPTAAGITAPPYCSRKRPILTYKLSGTDELWQGGTGAPTGVVFANVYYYGVPTATQTSQVFVRMRAQFAGLGEGFA
jgi:hypothetical protein